MTDSKTLILVRHAKSSWSEPGLADHDRPLNKRGRRDAPAMARRLSARGPLPDALVTSSAVRAASTAEVFATELGQPAQSVIVEPEIYGAGVGKMMTLIRELDEGLDCVLLVGHNPTFMDLANALSDAGIHHLPTCGVVTLRSESDPWGDARDGGFHLVDFDFPKKGRA